MFGIGTGEMLVMGLVAIVWLALKGRAGAAMIVMGGLVLLVVLVVAGIVAGIFFSRSGPCVTPGVVESTQIASDGTQYCVSDQAPQSGVAHSQWTPDGKQYWPSGTAITPPMTVGNTTWFIALRPALLVLAGALIGFIAIAAMFARHAFAHSAAGHSHIWPVFLVVPIIALLVIGGVRYKSASQQSYAAQQHIAQQRATIEQQQRIAAARIEQKKTHRAELVEQNKKLVSELAEVAKSAAVALHIDQADIRQLMDEFDAPRIILLAPVPSIGPTSSSATFLIAAATTAAETAKEEAQDKAVAPAVAADDAPDKPQAGAIIQAENAPAKSNSETTHKDDVKTEVKDEAKAAAAVEAEAPAPPVAAVPPMPPAPPATETVSPETSEKEIAVDTVAKPAAAELGVAAATLPKWINDPPKRTGDVRREVMATEDYESAEECYAAADIYLMIRTYERLQQLRGVPSGVTRLPSITFHPDEISADGQMIAMGNPPTTWTDPRFAQLSQMGIGAEFLRREIVAKDPDRSDSREYLETVARSVGPMKKLYMQVEFTPAIDRELMRFAEAHSRQERFAAVGFAAGSVLTLLTMVWGLLKIDTATKGYYTKRLFLGVPGAIIAGVIAVITWMNYSF